VAANGAVERLAAGLLGGLGHVDVARDPPGGTVSRPSGRAGALLDDAPVRSEQARRRQAAAHRNPAPGPGDGEGLGALRRPGDGDRRVWLLERPNVDVLGDVGVHGWDGEAPVVLLVQAWLRIVPELEHEIDSVAGQLALVAATAVDADH